MAEGLVQAAQNSEMLSSLAESRVVLFDVHGTLTDYSYAINDQEIFGAIRHAQETGWTLGINSGVSLEQLQKVHQQLGLNGPIIAEKGAVLEHNGRVFLTNQTAVGQVGNIRPQIVKRLGSRGLKVIGADPMDVINSTIIAERNRGLVAVNERSVGSVGLLVRTADQAGRLCVNRELTDEVVECIRPVYSGDAAIVEEVHDDMAMVMLSAATINKRTGTQALRSICDIGKVAMVGDTEHDDLGSDIAYHFAVANAEKAFRDIAYTADSPQTAGAREILEFLLEAA